MLSNGLKKVSTFLWNERYPYMFVLIQNHFLDNKSCWLKIRSIQGPLNIYNSASISMFFFLCTSEWVCLIKGRKTRMETLRLDDERQTNAKFGSWSAWKSRLVEVGRAVIRPNVRLIWPGQQQRPTERAIDRHSCPELTNLPKCPNAVFTHIQLLGRRH